MRAKRLAIIGNQAFAMRNFRGALIAALVAKGIEVFALAPDYDETDRTAIRQTGATPLDYPLKRASISPFFDFATLLTLIRILRRIKPDVVLSFSTKPVVFGTLAAAHAGVPSRYALIEGLGHAFIPTEKATAKLLRRLVSSLYRMSLRYATRAFFLNDDDRQEFVNGKLVAGGKALTVGAIGVDLDEWRPAPPVITPLTFLFVGRLLREKGIVEFVEAGRRIKAQDPNARLVVLGGPDTNPSSITHQQISAWVAEGVIEWPGHVDVKPWLAQASVFVLPSYREGVPRSTQEAMAMARPVITTDVPGCRETVEEGQNGFLVAPRDAAGLVTAMARFVSDPSKVAQMGTASRRIAESKFDMHKATSLLLAAMAL
jgi:glycosyltransferase involved in cell wall biosynthesis